MKERKREFRKACLLKRDQIRNREEKSKQIIDRILRTDVYHEHMDILAYMPIQSEVNITDLLHQILADGKRLYLPKIYQTSREMEFFRVWNLSELSKGVYQIPEPSDTDPFDRTKSALILVPGAAYDTHGYRMGYGGGYYDRFLEGKRKDWVAIMPAFSEQEVSRLPLEQTDQKMDFIITPLSMKGWLNMEYLEQLGIQAKKASAILNKTGVTKKNEALRNVAKALVAETEYLIGENEKDIACAKKNQMKPSLVDRLALSPERIRSMAEGLEQIASLEDPVGEVISMKMRPNGLQVGQKRVPLGVIGIIYESRPNVTVDAFGLCFKTGNAVILRGGSDAIHSNLAIVHVIRKALAKCGVSEDAVQLLEDTNRETAAQFMKLNKYVDVLIPRGGAGLIKTVVEQSTIPVIETGTGNCHIYVDEFANISMAADIILNAKTQRLGVCNACESLVIHERVAAEAIPVIAKRLEEKGVEMRGDEAACAIYPMKRAVEEDWGTEYLDSIISIKVASGMDEAIEHIHTYNTKHSEAIITENYDRARKFLDEIDAAAVYVNASTRFTDGFEFGFGAEIGISTQKLHARGPMGLLALTTTKYIIMGNGQVRP